MGTLVSLTMSGLNNTRAETLAAEAFKLMENLSKEFSGKEKNTLRFLEKNAGLNKFTSVSHKLFFVLEKGIYYGRLSRGKFDITILPLIELWGFSDERNVEIPSDNEIKKTLSLINYKKIKLKAPDEVSLGIAGMRLDLGGIAKGYIVDMVSKFLVDNKVPGFIVDAGGDMAVWGKKNKNVKNGKDEKNEKNKKTNWKIGIQNPRNKKEIIYVIDATNISIATSGDYERFIIRNGSRYHHILDPQTGYPAKGLSSVTVLAETTLQADSLATTAFLLGVSDGLDLLEKLQGVEGMLITDKNQIFKTSGFTN